MIIKLLFNLLHFDQLAKKFDFENLWIEDINLKFSSLFVIFINYGYILYY